MPTGMPPHQSVKRSRKQILIFGIVLAVLSAASLILLLTITGGDETQVTDADVTVLSQQEVTDTLLRAGNGPGDAREQPYQINRQDRKEEHRISHEQ